MDLFRGSLPPNRSMPECVVVPILSYLDLDEAVRWLCRCFGFAERLRIADHRAQLVAGSGSIIVAQRKRPTDPSLACEHHATRMHGHSVMVRIADVDAHFKHVQLSDAQIVSPPADYPYGERQYSVEDLGGHLWTFSQTLGDIEPSVWGGLLREPQDD